MKLHPMAGLVYRLETMIQEGSRYADSPMSLYADELAAMENLEARVAWLIRQANYTGG